MWLRRQGAFAYCYLRAAEQLLNLDLARQAYCCCSELTMQSHCAWVVAVQALKLDSQAQHLEWALFVIVRFRLPPDWESRWAVEKLDDFAQARQAGVDQLDLSRAPVAAYAP